MAHFFPARAGELPFPTCLDGFEGFGFSPAFGAAAGAAPPLVCAGLTLAAFFSGSAAGAGAAFLAGGSAAVLPEASTGFASEVGLPADLGLSTFTVFGAIALVTAEVAGSTTFTGAWAEASLAGFGGAGFFDSRFGGAATGSGSSASSSSSADSIASASIKSLWTDLSCSRRTISRPPGVFESTRPGVGRASHQVPLVRMRGEQPDGVAERGDGRGEGGAGPHALGSTVLQVLEAVRTSLFVAHACLSAPVEAAPRHILVPLDGSPRSESVLPAAVRIASSHGAELLLVHDTAAVRARRRRTTAC